MKTKIFQEYLVDSLSRYKNNTAIEYGSRTMSYGELENKANHIANLLLNKGVNRETLVGILLEDRMEFICTMVGILKAGCVMVPLESTQPMSRLEVMIRSTNTKFIIGDQYNFNRFVSHDDNAHAFSDTNLPFEFIRVEDIFLDIESPGSPSASRPNIRCTPEDKIYLYFTSGTTGVPRAILGKSKSLLHFIRWEIRTFELDETCRISQLTSPGFDAFLRDIFTPLCSGGTICCPGTRDILQDPAALIKWIDESRIGLIHCVPGLFRSFNGKGLIDNHFKNLKYILMSGERINPSDLVDWYNKFDERIQLVNLWGTSETTLAKTFYFIKRDDVALERIPVGKPINGAMVVVLDRYLKICGEQVKGALYIRTPFRTFGYLNDPELTHERFIQNPFNSDPNDLLHVTGDMGALLPDGNYDLIGRQDRQVKIRGIRIELEEIEAVLQRYPQVKEAVVIKTVTPGANELLCAYVTAREQVDEDAFITGINRYLEQKLPDYMIPAHVIRLEELPRKPSGKIDQSRLSDALTQAGIQYAPPRNEIEKKLAALWSEILGIEKIGIDRHFFELGGNSLNIMTLITKIHQKFDVKITLAEIFNNLTIKQQAGIIKNAKSDRFLSIEKSEEKEYYMLSPAQKRLYILHQTEESEIAYNNPIFITMAGGLKKEKLGEIFKKLIQRHESLRTSFEIINDRPVQRIKKYPEIHFEIEYFLTTGDTDSTGEDGKKNRELRAKSFIYSFIRHFDLRQAPLLRVGLIEIEENNHIFMFDMHHIITDGTSHDIFTKEFMILYENGQLPSLRLQYKDFSQWQNRLLQCGEIKKQEEYWVKEFEDEPPILNLPVDYPRPQNQSFEGRTLGFRLGVEETTRLKELADAEEVTLYTLLLTIFNIMLARLTGQETIVTGTVIAGRRHADLHDIIGMFVNTMALKQYPTGDKTFTDFLEEVRKRTIEAFENQDYPFENLVEKLKVNRDLSRNPLFDVIFVFQNYAALPVEMPAPEEFSKLKVNDYNYEHTSAKFDLSLTIIEVGEVLACRFEYCTKLFKNETIERFIRFFKKTVSVILEEPGIRLKEIEITEEEEKKRLLYDFCAAKPGTGYPADKLIHELFVEQAEKTPDRTALIGQIPKRAASTVEAINEMPLQITYKELNKKSHQLACLLAGKGVHPDMIAAVMLDRIPEMVTGILGTLKAGAAYLPLDPEYPRERIDYMLKDSNARILVTTSVLSEKLLIDNCQLLIINEETLDRRRLNNPPQETPSSTLTCQVSPANLAYIIYTSGTTGKPKGTMIEHKNVVRLFFNDEFQFDFNHHDVWTLFHSFCFDFSVWEMYGALLYGGKLVLIPALVAKDTRQYLAVLKKEKVTVLNQVPTAFYNLPPNELNAPGKELTLRYIIFGGEALQPGKLTGWQEKYPDTKLINMYGITETTVHVTYKEIGDIETRENISNIGKPIPTLRTYIMDKYLRLLPVGIGGELCVGGKGVARGYLNRPELTAEKFIPNPNLTGDKLYRSGDLAKLLPNGEMEYLGRIDQQVKIRGFRIELGEIENQLLRHPEIKQAVVIEKEKNLSAYIVSNRIFEIAELKNFLSGTLPDYMIPSHFWRIDQVPLNPNGKINRKALVKSAEKIDMGEYIAPSNELEKIVASTWQEVLKQPRVGRNNNFFELGGTSLDIVLLSNRFKEIFAQDIPMVAMFHYPTVRSFAGYLNQEHQEGQEVKVRSKVLDEGKTSRTQRLQKRKEMR